MAKSPDKQTKPTPKDAERQREKAQNVDADPGAWDRFENAVDAAVKSGPMHRESTIPKRKKAKKTTMPKA